MSIKRDAADVWFSKCVRKRANWRCEHCGNTETLQACHIHGRRAKSVRWDAMNCVCMCYACHRRATENPVDFTRWLEKHLGLTHLRILNEKRQRTMKTTAALRKEIAAHYREQFRLMEDGQEFESWT